VAITGVHALLYSAEPDALRTTLRDVFGWEHVDAGGGWLIFALPPAELGVHPAEAPHHELSLLCEDIDERRFGRAITLVLPGDVDVLLYQPSHPTALP
jgi:hypothetical protein